VLNDIANEAGFFFVKFDVHGKH